MPVLIACQPTGGLSGNGQAHAIPWSSVAMSDTPISGALEANAEGVGRSLNGECMRRRRMHELVLLVSRALGFN